MRSTVVLILLILSPRPCWSADRFASPDGTGTGAVASEPGRLEDVLTGSADGDMLFLAPGTYLLEKELVVSKSVSISGSGLAELDCSRACVRLSGAGKGVISISGVRVFGAPKTAIKVESGSASLNSLEIDGNGVGLETFGNGAELVVSASLIARNREAGFRARAKDSVSLTGAQIEESPVGVDLAGGSVAVLDNTFTKTAVGVRIQAPKKGESRHQIRRNSFFGASRAAIVASGRSEASAVSSNRFDGNEIAIEARDGAATQVVNNLILASRARGISANGARAMFAFNTIVGSGSDGVSLFSGDRSRVVNSIIVGSKGWGVAGEPRQVMHSLFHENRRGALRGGKGKGNIQADPRFAPGGEFALQASSPAVDKGAPGIAGASEDFTGLPRRYAPDIGAMEAQPPPGGVLVREPADD